MQIIDKSSLTPPFRAVRVTLPESTGVPCVAAEHRLEVFVNERPAMRVVCTPEHMDELVLGRMVTEGIVASADEIRLIYICEQGLRARVMLQEGLDVETADTVETEVSTCCTDNRTLLTGRAGLVPVTPIPWDRDGLQAVMERMQDGEPLYTETHAVHACYLLRGNQVLCCREDIGRHNALDKVIGWACIHGIDLRTCMLFTTGRMPSDMVSKAVRSGIPVFASKTYPSDHGIELAKQSCLTLITVRKNGELIVWHDGDPGFQGES